MHEKMLSLRSHWQVTLMAAVEAGSPRDESGQWVGGRIKLKWGKGLPAALHLLAKPSGTQLQVGEATPPMVINLVPLLGLNDACRPGWSNRAWQGPGRAASVPGRRGW